MSKQYEKTDYEGASPSTLCRGCGHDLVSRALMKAFYQAQINPFQAAKISGIGCSSKTPAYFLKLSQGFNTIHGRMASIATGVKAANRNLKVVGISGDGDTGSIGLGSFLHTVRRNVPMVYIVENNGVYGLTKGQLSATAEKGSRSKYQAEALLEAMDLCRLSLEAGCGFVARSFSGDEKQLVSLLKLALKYKGFAFIDVISPCVVYGNEKEFPHSYQYMKDNLLPLNELDVIEEREDIQVEIAEGEKKKIPLPDGSSLLLKKLSKEEHDTSDKEKAASLMRKYIEEKTVLTGLIYYKEKRNFLDYLRLPPKPLVHIEEEKARPSYKDFNDIMKLFS